jgi:hypothetical protein
MSAVCHLSVSQMSEVNGEIEKYVESPSILKTNTIIIMVIAL